MYAAAYNNTKFILINFYCPCARVNPGLSAILSNISSEHTLIGYSEAFNSFIRPAISRSLFESTEFSVDSNLIS